ncbi:MAG: hypothetical protein JWN67_4431 [Actinomycetia bacterium]|nr:hypothetical protein [Actinomycetes bacterium]
MSVLPIDDDELLERMRGLAAVHDPVPAELFTVSRSAFALRTLDDELADLLFDSLLDEALVGIRGGTTRQLTFGVEDLTIDVDLDTDGLIGHVSPTGPATVELQTPDSIHDADVDELGRFFLDQPPSGPFRLRVAVAGKWVTTEWVNL